MVFISDIFVKKYFKIFADMDYNVIHNACENRFEVIKDGLTGYVEYLPFDGGIDIVHTIVPPPLRGHGMAQALVEAAIQYARKEKLRVIPSCSYAAAYVRRHPDEV